MGITIIPYLEQNGVSYSQAELVLPKGQIPDGQRFNVCINSTDRM
ncbi:MAG TPA: hypothetical protein VE076_03530 [Nitrososphaeraceae archaeon]|nr:hypothetical protein [Nitrososphaeraceae archaeon]